MVELDLDLRAVGAANIDLGPAAMVPLHAHYAAGTDGRNRSPNRSGAVHATELIRGGASAWPTLLVETDQLTILADRHLHERPVRAGHIDLALVTIASGGLRPARPDPSDGDRGRVLGAELRPARPERWGAERYGGDRGRGKDRQVWRHRMPDRRHAR